MTTQPDHREALEQAWLALDARPTDVRPKRLIARILRNHPALMSSERLSDLERMLTDTDVAPDDIAPAGWALVLARRTVSSDADPEVMAELLEKDSFVRRLLAEAPVTVLEAELAMTRLRRSLLLSGSWPHYPDLTAALASQALLNGGAWPFDDDERTVLEQEPASPFAATYLPQRPRIRVDDRFHDCITQAVSDQYIRWPYPAWSRLTAPKTTSVPSEVEKRDGGLPSGLPVDAEVLIAGCGTGWEAAYYARRFPDARITAIDISAASIAYAKERCTGLNVDLRLLDLHDVSSLDRRFDLIVCSGVLHHLPDPEAGWAKLVDVLNARGVMKVMLYSRVGRLRVEAAKARIADLRQKDVDDDVLRSARRRLIEDTPDLVSNYNDFYTLAGVHDFLFNRHEDSFDVSRIANALRDLRLELLAFSLPSKTAAAAYRDAHPEDPLFRDVRAWAALEKKNPFLFSGMYDFWCRRAS